MNRDSLTESPANGLLACEDSQVSLDELASSIRDEHAQVCASAQKALRHAIAAGRSLIQAKGRLPYGDWLAWLDNECKLSRRTAQAYMRLAKEFATLPEEDAQHVALLSMRGAFDFLTKRKQHRDAIDKSQRPVSAELETFNKIKAAVKKLERLLPPELELCLTTTPTDPAAPTAVEQLVASSEQSGCATRVSERAWIVMRPERRVDAPFESLTSVSTMVNGDDEINLD